MSDDRAMHLDDTLDALLDGRLAPADRLAAEQHLAGCEQCRRLHDTLVATRQLLRAAADAEPTPAHLAGSVRSLLAAAPVEAPRRSWRRRLAVAAAAIVLLALALWLRSDDPADRVAELVALQRAHQPAVVSSDVATLEAALAAELPFRPRVLDLAMMELRLVGGGTADIGGVRAAWMAYDGPAGRLVCVMYPGRLDELPDTPDVRRRDDFVFRVYHRDDLTVVAWQEGSLVCVLVGGGDPEAVVALAMGKAMLPAATG